MKKDNSTFSLKRKLRIQFLSLIGEPVILETHAGKGKLFDSCYHHVEKGLAVEILYKKAEFLAKQRPYWMIYQSDIKKVLNVPFFMQIPFNFIDIDPYGNPWEIIHLIFSESRRSFSKELVLVVNDGLRQKVATGTAWQTHCLKEIVKKYGNSGLYDRYKEACFEMMKEEAALAGYEITHWTAYYCGNKGNMTHYGAKMVRRLSGDPLSDSTPCQATPAAQRLQIETEAS